MMNNKLLKVISIVGVSVLAMGMLSGCGSQAASTENGVTPSASTASENGDNTSSGDNVITMGTNAEFEPFEYRENGTDITGFDVDLSKEIAKKLGKELKIEDMAFDTLPIALSSDKVDFVAAGMTVDEKRKTQVDFSDPYFKSKQVIIVKADDSTVQEAEDLKGKKVGVQLGTTGDLAVSAVEGVDVVQFQAGTLAVMDLKNGKVDAVVIDAEPAKKMTEGQSDLKIIEAPFVEEEYAIAIKKGNSELQKSINQALADLKADGTYDKIYAKYFNTAK